MKYEFLCPVLTEVKPNNRQKSFYGKAMLEQIAGYKLLYSYETLVCCIDPDNNFHRVWDGYSATTMKHVNAFCDMFCINYGGKAMWDKTPIEKKYSKLDKECAYRLYAAITEGVDIDE